MANLLLVVSYDILRFKLISRKRIFENLNLCHRRLKHCWKGSTAHGRHDRCSDNRIPFLTSLIRLSLVQLPLKKLMIIINDRFLLKYFNVWQFQNEKFIFSTFLNFILYLIFRILNMNNYQNVMRNRLKYGVRNEESNKN